MESGYIIQPEKWHNHASCIVQLPNSDLLACWYHGSGEREADDVIIEGSRFSAETNQWSERFLMADAENYPDCNPCMFIDSANKLWLVYVTILANEWHTALLRYRTSVDFDKPLSPIWNWSDVLHTTPSDSFITDVLDTDYSTFFCFNDEADSKWMTEYFKKQNNLVNNKLFRRLGWMPRCRAVVLSDNRIILPLYSDGFDFSIMLISDNNGVQWHTSKPIVSPGGVQPSVVERKNGDLAAYLRNNGPAPHSIMRTMSYDRGESWSIPEYIDLPNPGAGIEAICLKNGVWAMVYNDTDRSRHRLAIAVSTDEGDNWELCKYIENDDNNEVKGSYSYPSIIQTADNKIWITYTHQIPAVGNTIKWVRFEEDQIC